MRRVLPFSMALLSLAIFQPAAAREWKPSPQSQAMDYSQITDTRNKNIVFMWWLAPPAFTEPSLQPIFSKYFILGVAHAEIDATVDINFLDVEAPLVKDTSGTPLKLVNDEDQPPGVVAVLAGMRSALVKMIGPMGKGMKLFVYEPGSVDACKPGKVSIPLNNEVYTYDTPMPGCAGNQ